MDSLILMTVKATCFVLSSVIPTVAAMGILRRLAPGDDARAVVWWNRLMAVMPLVIAAMAIAYAAIASGSALWIFYGLTLGEEQLEPIKFLTLPCLVALSALFAWIGLHRDHACHLLARLKRACGAALDAFSEPLPDHAKPKPDRSAYDLD